MSANPTPDLEALRALSEAAGDGPWMARPYYGSSTFDDEVWLSNGHYNVADEVSKDDAAFIIAATAFVRHLLANPSLLSRQGAEDGAGWRPIATVPVPLSDFTASDLGGDADSGPAIAWADADDKPLFLVWWAYQGQGVSELTHWRPLPAPPLPTDPGAGPQAREARHG